MNLLMSLRFIFDDDWNDVPCSHHNVICLQSRPLNFRVIIHAYSLLPQTYLRSSLARYLGTDHLISFGEGGGGVGGWALTKKWSYIRNLSEKIMHKKVPEQKNSSMRARWIFYEQVFKNTRKNRSPLSGEFYLDIYNHPPKIAQINLQWRHFQDHFNQFMLKTITEFIVYITVA